VLEQVFVELATAIVRDGEGATKFVTIGCNSALIFGIHQIVIKLKFNDSIMSLNNCLSQIPFLRTDASN
jgi:N-acetylglutamate synthase/N-acetylornithine aminotransferase